jgi:hypothetical protein
MVRSWRLSATVCSTQRVARFSVGARPRRATNCLRVGEANVLHQPVRGAANTEHGPRLSLLRLAHLSEARNRAVLYESIHAGGALRCLRPLPALPVANWQTSSVRGISPSESFLARSGVKLPGSAPLRGRRSFRGQALSDPIRQDGHVVWKTKHQNSEATCRSRM